MDGGSMKKGLILEGGALRGLFSAGVIDVMMENNVTFDGLIGVSAGAAFGCNYKSSQIGRAIRYNMQFCNDPRFSGIRSLITSGDIYNAEFAYGEVPLVYDPFDFEAYKAKPMDFYVVCTDIKSGEAIYHKYLGYDDHGFDWVRASASMPLVSNIVEIDGLKLLDGGIADSIPIKKFEEMGYEKNVVVLTQPYDYEKKKNGLLPLLKLKYKKYPKMLQAMEKRHIIYNNTLSYIKKKEKEGKVFVIRPEKAIKIKKVEKDPNKLKEVYDIGRNTTIPLIDDLKNFLK